MKEATNQRAFLFGGLFACPCDLVRAGTSRVGQATAARWLRLYRSHVSHCFIDCSHIDLNPALSGQFKNPRKFPETIYARVAKLVLGSTPAATPGVVDGGALANLGASWQPSHQSPWRNAC